MLALAAYVSSTACRRCTRGRDEGEDNLVFFYVPFALLFVLLRGSVEPADADRVLRRARRARARVRRHRVRRYHTRTLLLNPKVIDANQFATYFRVNSLSSTRTSTVASSRS